MNILAILFLVVPVFCSAKDEDPQQIRIGNLALPTSQQPGPLFSFGQNIVDAQDAQVYVTAYEQDAQCSSYTTVVPSFLYGFTDSFSLFVTMPCAVQYKNNDFCSSGSGDGSVQFEYAFFNKNTENYADLITLVVNGTIPSGSFTKQPSTGAGAPGCFIGLTCDHIDFDWYLFACQGFQLYGETDGAKSGNQYFFQAGITKNIAYFSDRWIVSVMVEFLGTHSWRDTYNGMYDCNSGGTTLFCGPSLWFSTDRLIVQAGITGPVVQQLNGNQSKLGYYAALDIGWKF